MCTLNESRNTILRTRTIQNTQQLPDYEPRQKMSFFLFSYLRIYLSLKCKSAKDLEPFLKDGLKWKSVLAGVPAVDVARSSVVTLQEGPEPVSTQPQGTNQSRGLKLKCIRGQHFDEKRARGPHKQAKMSPRATILPKSTLVHHQTVVLFMIKGILMTTRAA